jgi:hypothetical protein
MNSALAAWATYRWDQTDSAILLIFNAPRAHFTVLITPSPRCRGGNHGPQPQDTGERRAEVANESSVGGSVD